MKLLVFILLLIFCFYFFLFKNQVWFYHDDFDFLLGSGQFNLQYLLSPHNEHFLPLFKFVYYLEYSLFGLNPKPFFIFSILLHLITLTIIYKTAKLLTGKNFYAHLALILFCVNSNFFEVILWSTSQQTLLASLFIALGFLAYLKYRQKPNKYFLIISGLSVILASLSFGFGVFYPFFLFLISLFDKKINKTGKLIYFCTALLPLFLFYYFAAKTLTVVTRQSLNPASLPLVVYFFSVGIMEGLLSRFFYAPFSPSRIAQTNLVLMPFLNLAILIFLGFLCAKTWSKIREKLFRKTVLILLTFFPYLIISLGRYPFGAKAAMSERYVYLPLFFFVLFLVYELRQFKQTLLLKKLLLIFAFWTVTSHSFFFYQRGLKWGQQPQQAKKFMLGLAQKIKAGQLEPACKIPKFIKDREDPCANFVSILKRLPEK